MQAPSCGQSHKGHERAGYKLGLVQTIGTAGAIARDRGTTTAPFALLTESAGLAHELGWLWWEGGMLAELAALSLKQGRVEEAEADARQSLELAERVRDRAGRVFGVGLLALVAAEKSDHERAGLLWGAIEDEHAGAPLGGWRRHRDASEARIRELAGPDFERGREQGRTLTLDGATELAQRQS